MDKSERLQRIADNTPKELQAVARWVGYKMVLKDNGKFDKVPYDANTGNLASSTDPATWGDFEQALQFAHGTEGIYGLGIVLSDDDALAGVDLDNSVTDGDIATWAIDAAQLLNSYAEISPSGKGLRVFCYGKLPPKGRKKGDIEMYQNGRFMTVTGDHLPDTPCTINERCAELAQLHQQIFGDDKPKTICSTLAPVSSSLLAIDDRALLDKMFTSKNGAAIRSLWDGNQGDNPSSADQSLCNHLAFWTGRDANRMDRLFRQSGLVRDKWDRNARTGETYGEGTIARAIAGCAEVYTPADDPMNRIIHDQGNNRKDDSWPYVVRDKQIYFCKEVKKEEGGEIVYTPLADFEAKITGENTDEDGNRVFVISGEGVRGGKFSMEIAASDYGDGRKLAAALEAAVGAKDPIYVGCAGHMAPAIKKLTGGDLVKMQTFNRTGWVGKTFLMPGREPDGTKIILTRKLTYAIDHSADLAKGLEALESLIQFTGPMTGTVVLSALFQAPLAALADWRNERYALFIKGRTGTQKTATTQVAMCIYGPDFARDEMILKFGEGATRNALMAYAVSASDLPMLIDNYKPSTGGGARDFTNLIHNILEGGEKERLNRSSQLKETKPIHTWPVCTGEDLPSNDPASLARILVVTFDARNRGDISHLSNAQSLSKHLCAVGESWIAWLEGEEGRNIAKTVSANFATARESWAKYLLKTHPNMVNPYRVATNLATNQLTWIVLSQHPEIGPIAQEYMADQKQGLTNLASEMAGFTAEALEVNRFIASLKEMIAGGRAIVLGKTSERINEESPTATRTIGWYADDGSAYLLPEATVELVKKNTGDSFGNISRNALYEQLDQLNFIASKNKDRQTKLVRIAGDVQRILHLTKEAVSSDAEYHDPDE